jgi:hypothetical protein
MPCEHVPLGTTHLVLLVHVTPIHRSIPAHTPEKHYTAQVAAHRTRQANTYATSTTSVSVQPSYRIVVSLCVAIIASVPIRLSRLCTLSIRIGARTHNVALVQHSTCHVRTQVDACIKAQAISVQAKSHHTKMLHSKCRCKLMSSNGILPIQTPCTQ